ncbi:E3 ubiquitin-protein ligase RBBP6-like isoform X2 [Watersipora subatra]|uniref:E3 ubiquitin-protein ligase RBBP6-like isoform X2 n=1 Tax=Watersipora subatra TaxID=2589382 RepID=UPI00355B26CF
MNEDSHLTFLAKRAESTVSMAEQESIQAMMAESTNNYDVQHYTIRPRCMPRAGQPHSGYICKRCNKPGHFYMNCPLASAPMMPNARFSLRNLDTQRRGHGIPIDFLQPADANTPGAFWSKYGYVINKKDAEAYEEASKKKKSQSTPQQLPEFEIPDNFICPLCKKIMTDAVKTACCVTHFCDSCIREALLEDEDQSCPQCNEVESPDGLVPDIILRNAISTFLNKTNSGFRLTRKVKKPIGSDSPSQLQPSTGSPTRPVNSVAVSSRNTPDRISVTSSATSPSTTAASMTSSTAAVLNGDPSTTDEPGSSSTPAITSVADGANKSEESTDSTAAMAVNSTVAADTPSSTSLGEAAPGTVPVTIVPSSSSATLASSTAGPILPGASIPPQPAVLPVATVSYTGTPQMLYNVSSTPFPGVTYPPVVAPSVPAPSYTQFPPGMRPGLISSFGQPVIPSTSSIMTKEEFYKTKAELLEQKMNEGIVKPKDKMMDAFGEYLRPRNRSRSRTPRGRSRSRSRRRGYSRSPVRRRTRSPPPRRRSISPRPIRRSSPGYRYTSRSPPPYRGEYRRTYPDAYYPPDSYYRSRREEMYRDERYAERLMFNGGKASPYDRSRYSPFPRAYTPERRDYGSPRSRAYSPRREERLFEEKDRRHYDEDIFRYEEERRRDYREYDRKYVEEEYERRHKVDRDDEYFRKSSNSKYDDKYEDRYSKYDERHDGKYSKYDERYDGKSSKYEEKNEGRSSQYDGKYDDGMSNDKYLKRDDKPEGRSSKHGKKYGEKSRKDKQESRLSEREESHTPKKNIKSEGSAEPEKRHGFKSYEKEVDKVDRAREKKRKRKSQSPIGDEKAVNERDSSKAEKEPTKKKSKKTEVSKKPTKTEEVLNSKDDDPSKPKSNDIEKKDSFNSSENSSKELTKSNKKKSSSKPSSTKKSNSSSKATEKKKKKRKATDASKEDEETHTEKLSRKDMSHDSKESDKSVSNTSQSTHKSVSETSQSTRKSHSSSQLSHSPPLADLTGEDEEESTQSETGDDIQTIKVPQPSKWEKDDSESDVKHASPPSKKHNDKTNHVSRKVIESAEHLLRNKRVQPLGSLAGEKHRRNITLYSESTETDTQAEQGNESDASDGKSDLRKKILRIKERKNSSGEPTSSDRKREHSSFSKVKSAEDKYSKSGKGLSKSDPGKKSLSNRDIDKHEKDVNESTIDKSLDKTRSRCEKQQSTSRSSKSHSNERPSSRKSDTDKRAKADSRQDVIATSASPNQNQNGATTKEKSDTIESDDEAANKPNEVIRKLDCQTSEETFEPDYDIDISEAHTSVTNLLDNESQDADSSASMTATESDGEERSKKKKNKHKSSSKSKHKKSKKHSKRKHRKHKDDK